MKNTLLPTRNRLSPKIRRAMVDLLNQNLADVLDLFLQAKQAHWNVKGSNFIALHELFDKVAEATEEFSDDIAERAVALGGLAQGTLATIGKSSRLTPYPPELSDSAAHVDALSNSLADFGDHVRKAIDEASQAGDADTADLFTGVSREVDKLLWMVEAHAF